MASKPSCRNGHTRTSENTYPEPRGWSECRECRRARDARRYERLMQTPQGRWQKRRQRTSDQLRARRRRYQPRPAQPINLAFIDQIVQEELNGPIQV